MGNWSGPVYWATSAAVLFTLPSIEEEEATLDRLEQREKQGNKLWIQEERELLRRQAIATPVIAVEDVALGVWHQHISLLTIFVSGSLVAVMAACTVLRTHLFIWTVFSPKFLFAMAWGVGWHLGVNVLLGGLFWCAR